MPSNYVPIFLFIAVVAVMIPLPLILAKLVRPNNPGKEKLMPYECGIDPVDDSRQSWIIALRFRSSYSSAEILPLSRNALSFWISSAADYPSIRRWASCACSIIWRSCSVIFGRAIM